MNVIIRAYFNNLRYTLYYIENVQEFLLLYIFYKFLDSHWKAKTKKKFGVEMQHVAKVFSAICNEPSFDFEDPKMESN